MPRQDPGGSKDRIRQNEQLALLFPESDANQSTHRMRKLMHYLKICEK